MRKFSAVSVESSVAPKSSSFCTNTSFGGTVLRAAVFIATGGAALVDCVIQMF